MDKGLYAIVNSKNEITRVYYPSENKEPWKLEFLGRKISMLLPGDRIVEFVPNTNKEITTNERPANS